MSDLINLSICLSDIPKEKIKKGNNGKSYANITVARRREPDQYGNTHSVFMGQLKEEREAGAARIYIGNGKGFDFNQSAASPPNAHPAPTTQEPDDLPW